jgi:uncharacterized delta-60 repeat protein
VKVRKLLTLLLVLFCGPAALAWSDFITYEGTLIQNSVLVTNASQGMKFQIVDNRTGCVLYEETQSVNVDSGEFTAKVGKGSVTSGSVPFANIFSNTGSNISGVGCTYNPIASDTRKLVVIIQSGATWGTLSSIDLGTSPQSETLAGKTASEFIQTTTDVTQANVNALFVPSVYNNLLNLSQSSTGAFEIPSGTTAQRPPLGTETIGMIRYNSSNNNIEFYNGSSWTSPSSSGVNSVSAADSTITITGTASAPSLKANVGTTAGSVAAGDDARIIGAIQNSGFTPSIKAGSVSAFASETATGSGRLYVATDGSKIYRDGAVGTWNLLTSLDYNDLTGRPSSSSFLPAQTGSDSGKFLTTNGSSASWATINGLESTSVSNIGSAGVGVYKQMSGSPATNIQLKKIATGPGVTINDDTVNDKIDIGVNSELQGLGGLNSNGFVKRTATGIYSAVSISTSDLPASAILPAQGSNSGKYLKTDGVNAAWSDIVIPNGAISTTSLFSNPGTNILVATDNVTGAGLVPFSCSDKQIMVFNGVSGWQCVNQSSLQAGVLPDQNGNNGKVLTTNGSTASWQPANTGGISNIVSVSGSTYSISTSDNKALLDISNVSSQLTLPLASAAGAGYEVLLAGPSSGSPNIKVITQGSDYIGNAKQLTLFDINASVRLVSTGSRWIPFSLIGGAIGDGMRGLLDLNFNGTGFFKITSMSYFYSAKFDSSGRVIFTGDDGTGRMTVWRYLSDGNPDTSFGSSGKFNFGVYSSSNIMGGPDSIAIDSSGNIIVIGTSYDGVSSLPTIIKLTSTGNLDTSFNGTGYGRYFTQDQTFRAIAVNSNNDIIAVGHTYNGFDYDPTIWKFNSSGVQDTTFGSSGVATYNDGTNSNDFQYVTVDNSGNIYASGNFYVGFSTFKIVKYNSAGSIDTSYGSSGEFSPAYINGFSPNVNRVLLDSSNKILMVGSIYNGNNQDMWVSRVLADGSNLDSSFANAGTLMSDVFPGANAYDYGFGALIDSSGNIYVTGQSNFSSTNAMAVWKLNGSGAFDFSFSNDGIITATGAGTSGQDGQILSLDSNGRLLVVGMSNSPSYPVIWRIK